MDSCEITETISNIFGGKINNQMPVTFPLNLENLREFAKYYLLKFKTVEYVRTKPFGHLGEKHFLDHCVDLEKC